MNFKEYFQPIDTYLIEEPQLLSRAVGRVDPSIADPQTGKPYRKFEKIKQIKTVFEKAVNNNTKPEDIWGNFSCVQRLGPKYSADDGGTPLGLYAFPLEYIIKKNVSGVPMAGSRKYLHIFKIKNKESYISMKPGEGEIKEISDVDEINKTIKQQISNYIYKHENLKIKLLKKTIKEELLKSGAELYSDDIVYNFYHNTVSTAKSEMDDYSEEEKSIKKYSVDRIEKLSSKENFERIISELTFNATRMMINFGLDNLISSLSPWPGSSQKLPLFTNLDNNSFALSDEVRNFANKMIKTEPFSSGTGGISRENDRKMLEMLGNDKISLEELTKISKSLRSYVNLGSYFRDIDASPNFNTYIESYFLLSNKKVKKLLDYWVKKIGNFEVEIAKRKKEISESIKVPFGKELQDFCEKNDIDWNQALMKSLISLRSSGKQDVSGKFLYVITKKISDMIIAKKGYIGSNRGEKEKPERNQKKYRPWAMWTGLLRKLGIDGLLDSHDTGSIYPSEPTQGVFFSTKNIELISTIIINQIGECDNDYYDKQKKDEIRFGLDATPKEKWFMGLERNLSKVQTELGNVKYYGMGKIERVLNNFFVLCSSLVREAKKISEDEYQALITKGIFNKDKVRYIGTNLNYILSMTGPGIITEELKIQINKAILLSDQLISSGLFDGDYSKIDFSKIGSTKEGISKSQTGVANIGKRFVRILGEMQRKFRVISYDNNMDATYKSREINDVIDSFIQTMINLESVDVKLSNRFDLNPHWRQTKEFSEIKSLVFVILEFVMNLEGSFKYQPQFAKILSKIKQIKSCVKVGYNNDKTIKFWCYQVSKK